MKLLFKRMALFFSLLLISTSLIGCSKTELQVLDSIIKSSQALSSEKSVEASITFDYSGVSEEIAPQLEMVKQILNQMTLSMNMKSSKNESSTVAKYAMEGKVDYFIPLEFGLWIDMDLTNLDNPKFVEIIKQPSIIAPIKPYMAIDLASSLTTDHSSIVTNLLGNSAKMSESILSFVKDFAKDFDLGETIITHDSEIEVDGVQYPKYHLQIKDKTLKSFIRRLIIDFIDNDKAYTFIEELLALQQQSFGSLIDDLDEPFVIPEPTDEEIEELKTIFNGFMDKIEDVTILGSEGISIDYAMNDEGYIIYESGVITIQLDLEEVAKAMALDEDTEDATGIYTIELMYTINTKNINQPVTIDMPKLSHDIVSSESDMLSMSNDILIEPTQDIINTSRDINIYANDTRINLKNKPLLVNGTTLAPIREVVEAAGGDVIWIADSQMIIVNINESSVELKIDSDMAFYDGELNTLEESPKFIEGRAYVPVRYIAETIGGTVTWDNSTSSIHIAY